MPYWRTDLLLSERLAARRKMTMADECIFCKIVRKELPSQPIYEDHDLVAFPDIKPIAPVHVLIVPKEHMVNLNDVGKNDAGLLGKMLRLSAKIANDKGIAESGYRIVINNGDDGGQVVPHLHLHLIGGKTLDPKMG
ncbi:MAG TPA: histidine triad nucleotide-binding protein [Candidatus Deferrimicrobiaceae bacterium]|nr:histidine triad nucleotide-binding protein [Candidatus Deferrimicrobiaceae bacterium]